MTPTKRPSFQFYPGDWLEDIGLRASSLAARGLWADMLCFMHQGEPYGHLRKNGENIGPDQLARMVGAPKGKVIALLAELQKHHVLSRNDQGTIYSRRQVRDEALRNIRAEGGPDAAKNPRASRPGDPRAGGRGGVGQGGSQGGMEGGGGRNPPSSPSSSPSSSSLPESPNGTDRRAGGAGSNGGPPAPPASDARWILDHDESNPVEVRLASRVAHLSRLMAEREGEADPREILAAVSATEEGKFLDHIRGAPERWFEPTLRACDKFEADNFGEEPQKGRP